MKKLLTGAAMLAALGLTAASAQDSGVYVGGQLGGNWVLGDSSDFDIAVDGVNLGGVEYEGGVMLGAVAGYKIATNFAVEVEGTWRHNQYNVLDQDDEGSVYGVMANALYLAPIDDATTMYFGLGAGFQAGDMDDLVINGNDVDPDIEGGFAYQAKIGFDYMLDSGNTFGVGLSYMQTDFEVSDDVAGALGVIGDEFELDYGALAGFITYKFGM